MSTALETVTDYIKDVRTLLLDEVAPYRYDDPSLLRAFNMVLMDARRLRADLFVFHYGKEVPAFSAIDTTPLHFEQSFRMALVYGVTGHALARDQEDVQDSRAATFTQDFEDILTGVRRRPIQGGSTPTVGAKKQ